MFRQYFKQAIQMLKENRLTSVISILGTALSIAMILVVILQFQIKLVGFRPESNRDRMLYIMGIRADSRDSETRNSTAMARKLFGSEDPIGKEVLMGYVPYAVTGVVEAPTRAANSAYADVWVPYTSNTNYVNGRSCGGVCGSFQGVILAYSASDFEAIRAEIKQAVSRYNAAGREFVLGMNFVFSRLDVALGSNDMDGGIRRGWKEYLTQTAPLLLFLLLVPTLNLTGVVQSSVQKRRSEVGLRKAFGATKGRLLTQVLCENLIITLIGGLIGIVLSVILLQLGKSFLLTKDTVVTFEMLFKPVLFAAALFFTLLLNLLSAGLPAIRISREQIVEALNNK